MTTRVRRQWRPASAGPFWTAALFFAWISLASPAFAQTTTATLRGKVSDGQAGVLPGATVTARQTHTNTSRASVTSELGQYVIPNLPPGPYDILVELPRFATTRRSALVLQVGQEVTIDFVLTLATVQETIEVVGGVGLLEITKTSLGATIKNDQLDALPVVNRDFSSLALLAPGVTTGVGGYTAGGTGAQLSFNGQRAFTNGVFVDGASNMWQRYGKQASTFSQDWIQEFQVLTNSFPAEFGTASGGIINVITRSGSNQWKGRGYAFFQDSRLNGAPFAGRFDNGQPVYLDEPAPFTQQRWGGFLGGPLVKDKMFFFVGNENLLRKGTDLLGISDYWRAQGEQTAIPTRTTDHPFLIKIDMNVGASSRAFIRFDRSINMNYNQGGSLTTMGARQTFGGPVWNLVGSWTRSLSNSMFTDARASFLSNKPLRLCNQAGTGGHALLDLGPPGTFSSKRYPGATFGCAVTGLDAEQDLTLMDTFSVIRGRHHVKVGGQAVQVRTIIDTLGSFNAVNGEWTFLRDGAFDINNPLSYPDTWAGGWTLPRYSEPAWSTGLFAQDSWTVRDDVTLNLGVRYDIDQSITIVNKFIDAKNARLVQLVGGDPPYHTQSADKNNIAPRFGIVWRPGGSTQMTVRGAAGIFYDMNHNNYTSIVINDSLLADNTVSFNANRSLENPFWNAADPAGSRARLRAYLAQFYPYWPDLALAPQTKQRLLTLDGLKVASTRQYTAGLSHALPFGIIVDADVVYAQGVDGIVGVNDNVRFENGQYVEPDPRFRAISHLRNLGWTRYRALQTQAQYRHGTDFMDVSYTLARSTSNYFTTILVGGEATNSLDLSEDEGADDSDRRHNLTIHGSYIFPLDIQLGAIFAYRSALPYSVSTQLDLDNDPFRDRPEPRNSRRGDSVNNVDLRATKILKTGRAQTSVFWELFNAFNTTNFTGYQGSLESQNFGRPVAALPMRQQFGLRFDF